MTTYKAIEKIIDEGLGTVAIVRGIVLEAYLNKRIDGEEYAELINKVERSNKF